MTAQVATVRQRMSVPANFQMANNAERTATRMQPLVVQKEMLLTISGFKKPRFFLRGCEFSKATPPGGDCKPDCPEIGTAVSSRYSAWASFLYLSLFESGVLLH